jgi:chemotaxis receptor (MCP) glutamine deamidase CheD
MTIVIEAGKSDQEAIREYIKDCFVPILAEKFMCEREKDIVRKLNLGKVRIQ